MFNRVNPSTSSPQPTSPRESGSSMGNFDPAERIGQGASQSRDTRSSGLNRRVSNLTSDETQARPSLADLLRQNLDKGENNGKHITNDDIELAENNPNCITRDDSKEDAREKAQSILNSTNTTSNEVFAHAALWKLYFQQPIEGSRAIPDLIGPDKKTYNQLLRKANKARGLESTTSQAKQKTRKKPNPSRTNPPPSTTTTHDSSPGPAAASGQPISQSAATSTLALIAEERGSLPPVYIFTNDERGAQNAKRLINSIAAAMPRPAPLPEEDNGAAINLAIIALNDNLNTAFQKACELLTTTEQEVKDPSPHPITYAVVQEHAAALRNYIDANPQETDTYDVLQLWHQRILEAAEALKTIQTTETAEAVFNKTSTFIKEAEKEIENLDNPHICMEVDCRLSILESEFKCLTTMNRPEDQDFLPRIPELIEKLRAMRDKREQLDKDQHWSDDDEFTTSS